LATQQCVDTHAPAWSHTNVI